MKLRCWMVTLLLSISALLVLGVAGWWWLTWPERTARRFADLIDDCQWEHARGMLAIDHFDGGWFMPAFHLDQDSPLLNLHDRSFEDYLCGHQSFGISHGGSLYPFTSTAQGKIEVRDSFIYHGNHIPTDWTLSTMLLPAWRSDDSKE